ncbi:MAG: hypothetical protein EI684_03785 [Candidatus Viridilinea halotolerans]|uniref:Histidine kinase N-terminal 7TM region domain-containing protein n=1 Tax=Candidatus Viridilinea halotolerans TaxID=2491704 RepID=A0A426U790_9CHLR|nr:MAG: hypothetical protein EI684_03785 [Candidatus Viridilinea halotolerans]
MLLILDQLNQLLAAAVLIVTFSLLAYIAMQNWRNAITRALLVLLSGVVVVYGGDLLLARATQTATIEFLARAQWLGIALVPAAYIHLANGLLAISDRQQVAKRTRPLILVAYAGSIAFFLLVVTGTDLVVRGELPSGPIAQFRPGPLFWGYTIFFIFSALTVMVAIVTSERSALTITQRRRLRYLGATFAAPGIGVFPFLVLGAPSATPTAAILLLQAIASMTVAVMITVMTYSVAFQGVLIPDRLIKQDFLRWWLYGPFVGISIVLFMQVVPLFERVLGLPQNTLITFGVMFMTVLMPIFVSRVKPYLDALVYMQDQDEIDYLRNLPRSTFTRADLRALLENSLVAICGALRVETGFVAAPSDGSYTIKAVCGPRSTVKRFAAEYPLDQIMPQLEQMPLRDRDTLPPTDAFLSCGGFCLLPLRSPDGLFLGSLAVAYAPEQLQRGGGIAPETRQLISVLAHQMELALSTVQMQQRIFDTLRGLGPEMESLQQLASRLEQATPETLSHLDSDLILDPAFPQLVKEALNQFWGGPKLSDSPLLSLRTVRRMIQDQGGNRTRALQTVLRQAIDNLRPDEHIDPSAQEWLLYNLLEGRFLQRKTVRDVANRLAMSESDFYRKQRVAIEEVARQLALMEDSER